MKTYFVGSELNAFDVSASGAAEATTGAYAGFTRGGILLSSGGNIRGYLVDSDDGQRKGFTGTVWAHVNICGITSSTGSVSNPVSLFNSAGTEVVALIGQSSTNVRLGYWNGSGYTLVGSNQVLTAGQSAGDVDIQVVIHASAGAVRWFLGQVLIAEVTGIDTSGFIDIASIRFQTSSSNSSIRYCQCIVADYNTLGHTVRTRAPTGNGAHTAWTGAFGDIDEFPSSDSDLITTTAVGDKETFTAAALSATPANQTVKAVAVAARIRNDGGAAPQNAKPMLRIGGVDYVSGFNFDEIGLGYKGLMYIWQEDPSTAGNWGGITNVNASEFGLESAT